MRQLVLKLTLLTLCSFFTLVSQASALDYKTAYMVTGNNSYTLSGSLNNYTYAPGQTPWVYIKFKLADLALSSPLQMRWVWSSLTDPNITETQLEKIILTGLGTDKEVWKSAPQPWWNNNGGPGIWTVDVNWVNVFGNGSTGQGLSSANFSVTPEPLSSALFLLGGAPLAARILRRKNQNV